jgi:hypothetical protein
MTGKGKMANARVALEAIMIELGPKTVEIVDRMYTGAEAFRAKQLLITQCGSNVPFGEDNTPSELDRLRLAALKVRGWLLH